MVRRSVAAEIGVHEILFARNPCEAHLCEAGLGSI